MGRKLQGRSAPDPGLANHPGRMMRLQSFRHTRYLPFQSHPYPSILRPRTPMASITTQSGSTTAPQSQSSWLGNKPDLGAYIDKQLFLPGAPGGVLSGRTVTIKDLYDVAGQRVPITKGKGPQPEDRVRAPPVAHHAPPATATSPAVQRLLDAGASVCGRTHMDELAYSLNGENFHYGTPENPAAAGRIPGGSSSGSAVAVAAGHVDIGLGSDTGGSVRVPASYCGIYGMRPTHGRVSLAHARPLAPSFDTVSWFTRTPDLLATVGSVLLEPCAPTSSTDTAAAAAAAAQTSSWRLLMPSDAWELAEPATVKALQVMLPADHHMAHVRLAGGEALEAVGLGQLTSWMDVFRVCQAREIWQEHGTWVTEQAPTFGPGIKERFAMAAGITHEEWVAANAKRQLLTSHLASLLGHDGILVMPTAPGPAPLCNTPAALLDDWRKKLISLNCIAGLAGLPQINLPTKDDNGLPVGLSLVGSRGSDEKLLQAALSLTRR